MPETCKSEYTFSDPDFVDGAGMGIMSNKWEIICSQRSDLLSLGFDLFMSGFDLFNLRCP